jgi:RimJ/RimL family protein N-acetyltransferase
LQTPPGIDLLPANAAALARLNPDGAAALSEEMCSERVSVEDFLAQSFGVCLAEGDELVGFCLSEYNLDGCCEVGVGVAEAYRRRGLGTLLTQALLDAAHLRGVHTVGWHCWKTNQASAALARKAGLEWVKDFPVAMIDLD